MAVKATSMSEAEGVRCPVCRKPAVHDQRPFCSKRCADIDLARWLGGRYVIGGSNAAADEDPGRAPPAPGSEPDPEDLD